MRNLARRRGVRGRPRPRCFTRLTTGRRILAGLVVIVLGGSVFAATPARSISVAQRDCSADLGEPDPGTPEWNAAYDELQACRTERPSETMSNPAYWAASAANGAGGSRRTYGGGDPFRDTETRWAGKRGEFRELTWTDNGGTQHLGELFGPSDAASEALPGVIYLCHSCFPRPIEYQGGDLHTYVAQVLAERGYLVFFADIGGNSIPNATAATDFFLATAEDPTVGGEYNPWYQRLDRSRLGLVSHSGGAAVALNFGNTDPRVDTVVSFDRAGSFDNSTVQPRVPTLLEIGDFSGDAAPAAKPVPPAGSKYLDYEVFEAAGVDVMQVVPRASTHADWLSVGCVNAAAVAVYHGCTLYGEQVATYFMMAWFDRYLRGASDSTVAADALQRLTVTDKFDDSSDQYSIGTGTFDAAATGSTEAGNVPITLAGRSVRNRLSFWYPTRYSLAGGALQCDDVRGGCGS